MERRGFLKGVFGGITAAGLIVAAKPDEIAAFASPLVKDAPMVLDAAPLPSTMPSAGEHLYNARGELVAMVSAIHYTRDAIETTRASDTYRQYVQGLPQIHIEAIGVGTLVRTHAGFPELRGTR